MNKILLFMVTLIISVFSLISVSNAAKFEKNDNIAIMEFGIRPNTVDIDINVLNVGKAASEYITSQLAENKSLNIIDKTLIEEKIKSTGFQATGNIDSQTAQKLGKILGVDYIIYGSVNDVTVDDETIFTGVFVFNFKNTQHIVKSHIILKVIDVETGDIIDITTGEGESKSTNQKLLMVEVGNKKASQISIHNAIKKAAIQAVEKLFENES